LPVEALAFARAGFDPFFFAAADDFGFAAGRAAFAAGASASAGARMVFTGGRLDRFAGI
jgi:hypothetical protein